MEFLYALATNYMLICAVAGYFIAQVLKILIGLIRDLSPAGFTIMIIIPHFRHYILGDPVMRKLRIEGTEVVLRKIWNRLTGR